MGYYVKDLKMPFRSFLGWTDPGETEKVFESKPKGFFLSVRKIAEDDFKARGQVAATGLFFWPS